jgi:hypothetical protein
MLKVTQAVERKSREIFSAIVGEEITNDWHMTVYRLIVSAVHLYDAETAHPRTTFKIKEWAWPLAMIKDGKDFAGYGDQPWTVLLARASEIAKIHTAG